MALITLADVQDAAERIRGSVVRTPLIPAAWTADADRPAWIKAENLQPIGAFKVRGAFNAIGRLAPDVRARGVVAYSSGNHAQAVAYAAAAFGVDAQVVMPTETPSVKVEATRRYGAQVVSCAADQRERIAEELRRTTGATLIPPFDHPDVIAGQGTIGLELVADLPDVANVVVPLSGGGLASGIGTAVKALRPEVKVFGVEPEFAADTAESLRAGRRVHWPAADRGRTIADGLRAEPSELTFAHLRRVLDGVLTVSENAIRKAVRDLAVHAHLVAEPSGAVPLAAYRTSSLPPGPTVLVLTGGNVDPALLRELLNG